MQSIIDYLGDLQKNNNRNWYHSNKKRYEQECKVPFRAFVAELITGLQQDDPEIQIQPKDAVFRIARDTRFSKDKTPYKTHVSAIISKYGRKGKEHPGFYIHLEPGRLMLGGGAYFVERSSLDYIWNKIKVEHDRFRSLVKDKDFVEKFTEIQGERYKRIPKEYREFVKQEPYIANKQYFFMAEMPSETALRDDFLDFTLDYLRAGKPLNDFLAEAISSS